MVANNVGTLVGTTGYTTGHFGQAFSFAAFGDGVVVPPSPTLNIGAGTGVTMAAWINGLGTTFQPPLPAQQVHGAGPIIEYNFGVHLWHHNQQHSDDGLFANMAVGNGSADWRILQAPHAFPLTGWRHAATTYDKASGAFSLYVGGVMVETMNIGSITPATTTTLRIGARNVGSFVGGQFTFNGAIDEVQLYNRGLTGPEVLQLATATGTMCVPPPVGFSVLQMPGGAGESGLPFSPQPQIALVDANGNIVSNATTAVSAAISSGSGTLLGTATVNAVNGVATFTNLAIAGTGSPTITFSVVSGLPVTGGSATSPALPTVQVARKIGISTQPVGGQTGSPLATQPVVEVRDLAGLLVPGTTNPVTVSIGSGTGTLSGTTTVNAVNGVAAFGNLVVTGAGSMTLAFTAGGLTGTTSNLFTTAALPATTIAILTHPAGTESGLPFATQPVIELRDASGARATSATGSVTASIATGTGGTIAGTVTAPIVNGLATFTDLRVNGPGTFTLRFTPTPALPAVTSASITVVQEVRQLFVLSSPAVIVTGVAMSPWVLELRDAAGIKVASSTYLVRMGIGVGSGAVSGANEQNAVAGVVTFTNITVVASAPVSFAFWVVDAAAPGIAHLYTSQLTVLASNTVTPFGWAGFLQPLDSLPATNKVEGGSTVPIKFTIGGNKGLNILAAGYPASQPASCTDFASTGPATPIASAAVIAADFTYSGNHYQINWKTDKAWDGTCRILTVMLTDGIAHRANIRFK